MQILCEENITEQLFSLYNQLLAQHGHRKWWPADTPFEVALGAILTQATSWRNVEKAMENLKSAGAFTPEEIAFYQPDHIGAVNPTFALLPHESTESPRVCGVHR